MFTNAQNSRTFSEETYDIDNSRGDAEKSAEIFDDFFCKYDVQDAEKITNIEITRFECPLTSRAIAFVDYSQKGSMSLLRQNDGFHYCNNLRNLKSKHVNKHFSEGDFCPQDIHVTALTYENLFKNECTEKIPMSYVQPNRLELHTSSAQNVSSKFARFLDIHLGRVDFYHHSEFSLQQVVAKLLEDCYKEYIFIKKRLSTVKDELDVRRNAKLKLKEQFKYINGDESSCFFEPAFAGCIKIICDMKNELKELVRRENEISIQINILWEDFVNIQEKFGKEVDIEIDIEKEEISEEDFKLRYNKLYELELEDRIDELLCEISQNKGGKRTKRKLIEKTQKDMIHSHVEEFLNEICSTDTNYDIHFTKNQEKITNKTHKYFLKIVVDELEVCESIRAELINNTAEFNESFSIEVKEENKTINFTFSDENKIFFKHTVEIQNVVSYIDETPYINHKFSSDERISPKHSFVGSNMTLNEIAKFQRIKLKSCQFYQGKIITSGGFDYKIGWHNKPGKFNSNILKYVRLRKLLLQSLFSEKSESGALEHIIKSIYKDKTIIESLLDELKTLSVNKNIESEGLEFTDLSLKEYKNLIKASSSRIKPDEELLKAFVNYDTTGVEMIERMRFFGDNYIRKINDHLKKQFQNDDLIHPLTNLILDYECSTLKNIFTCSCFLMNPQNSQFRYAVRNNNSVNKRITIIVTVMKAFYIPERNCKTKNSGDGLAKDRTNMNEKSVRPFVKIACQDKSEQTFVASGSCPTWNQTLTLKIKPDQNSSVSFNIYDEVIEDFCMFESSATGPLSKAVNRWIGGVELPVSCLLNASRVEGFFKINRPPAILGYKSVTESHNSNMMGSRTEFPFLKDSVYLTLYIKTFPTEFKVKSFRTPSASVESQEIEEHLQLFSQIFRDFPNRNLDVFYLGANGKRNCIVKCLRPLHIPDIDLISRSDRRSSTFSRSSTSLKSKRDPEDYKAEPEYNSVQTKKIRNCEMSLETLLKFCARYVSLIPTVDNGGSAVLLGPEMLNVTCGSTLDHVILLTCYFLYLGVRCWIVCGKSFAKDKDFYVLIKQNNETGQIILKTDLTKRSRMRSAIKGHCFTYIIFDAVSAEVYNLQDEICPLKTIDFVFDEDNVWANVQPSTVAQTIRLDFSVTSEWRPCFTNKVYFSSYPSFDHDFYADPIDIDGLQHKLEIKIKSKIEKWRMNDTTVWNRYCGVLLQEMLPAWEYWAWNKAAPKPHQSEKLEQFLLSYNAYGFLVNLPFTNIKNIISILKTTEIYNDHSDELEMALGIELFSYPNAVVSVWINCLILRKKYD